MYNLIKILRILDYFDLQSFNLFLNLSLIILNVKTRKINFSIIIIKSKKKGNQKYYWIKYLLSFRIFVQEIVSLRMIIQSGNQEDFNLSCLTPKECRYRITPWKFFITPLRVKEFFNSRMIISLLIAFFFQKNSFPCHEKSYSSRGYDLNVGYARSNAIIHAVYRISA